MRVIMIDERLDRAGLVARLFRRGADVKTALEMVERLNPQVSLDRISPGTLLLLPDHPALRQAAGEDALGAAFRAFQQRTLASLDAIDSRVLQGYESLLSEGKEMGAVLKSPAFRKAQDVDPDLKTQVEEAVAVFKQDHVDARTAEAQLKAFREAAATELTALLRLIEPENTPA
jgi:hypothetical protein